MSRRKKSNDADVSLFPFLSILASLIGVLTLLIVLMVLSSVDVSADDKDKVAKAEEAMENKKSVDESAALIAKLEALMREAEDLRRKLESARAELERLKPKGDGSKDPVTERAKVLDEANRLQKNIDDMTKAMEELLKQIKELEEEIKKRKEPLPPAQVKIIPSGSGSMGDTKPVFMEVTKETVTIHQEDGTTKLFPVSGIGTNLDFIAILDEIAATEGKSMVLFLVRDDAPSAYAAVESLANSRNALNSKLPVIGRGKLDLSLFKTK